MGPNYSINIPVNLIGEEKLRQLNAAIRQTSEQVRITGTDLRTWTKEMEAVSSAGFGVSKSLQIVQGTLKEAGVNVDAFTDRLKINIRVQDEISRNVEKYNVAIEKQSEHIVNSTRKEVLARREAIKAIEDQAIATDLLLKKEMAASETRAIKDVQRQTRDRATLMRDIENMATARRTAMFGVTPGRSGHGLGDIAAWEAAAERERQDIINAQREAREAARRLREQMRPTPAAPLSEEEQLWQQQARILGKTGGLVLGAGIGRSLGVPGAGYIGYQSMGNMGLSTGTMAAVGAVGIGSMMAFELIQRTAETARWAQEQRNLSREFNVSIGEMARFTQISDALGTNMQQVVKQVAGLGEALAQNNQQSRNISTALHDLGLSEVTAFKPTAQAIDDIVNAIRRMPDQAVAARKAIDLLGDAGKNLAAMAKDMPSLEEKLNISDQALSNLSKASDKMGTLGQAIKAMFAEILGDFLSHLPGMDDGKPHQPEPEMTLGGRRRQRKINPEDTRKAKQRAANLETWRTIYRTATSTPESIYKEEMANVDREMDIVQKEFIQDLKLSPEEARTKVNALEARRRAAEDKRYWSEEYRRQTRRFAKLEPLSMMTPEEVAKDWGSMQERFGLITGTKAYKERYEQSRDIASGVINAQAADAVVGTPFKQMMSEILKEARERERYEEEARRGQLIETGVFTRGQNEIAKGQMDMGLSFAGVRGAARQGLTVFNRMDMTPNREAILDYNLTMQGIRESAAIRGSYLGSQIKNFQNALTDTEQVEGYDAQRQAIALRAELEQRGLELKALENDTLTKSIDAVNKFNESIVKASERMRMEFASGFESLVMGAQTGGGQGASSAIKGFFTKIEGTMLQNIGEKVWTGGAGNIFGQIGKGLPDWLTKGTVFGQLNDKKDAELIKNSLLTDFNTRAIDRNTTALNNRTIGTSSTAAGGSGLLPAPEMTLLGAGGSGGSGAGGVANEIAEVANVAASLSGVTSGTTSQRLGAVASAVAKVSKLTSSMSAGAKYSGNLSKIFSGDLHGGQLAGAIAGTAGLAFGAYQGISMAAHGGAKNVAGGAGMALASIAPFTGPAAPFVAAAGILAGAISSFLPDLKAARGREMERRAFEQQFIAPQAINIMSGRGGGYADVDFMGNVRDSHFSPYPIVSQSYLDVPRRSVIPGHILSGFGGYQNVTGAMTPTVIHYHNWDIKTMDSKSFLENGPKIADALNHTLTESYHPLIRTIGGIHRG